jgi:hypothetical protein
VPVLDCHEITLDVVDLEVLDLPKSFQELLVQLDAPVDRLGQRNLVLSA